MSTVEHSGRDVGSFGRSRWIETAHQFEFDVTVTFSEPRLTGPLEPMAVVHPFGAGVALRDAELKFLTSLCGRPSLHLADQCIGSSGTSCMRIHPHREQVGKLRVLGVDSTNDHSRRRAGLVGGYEVWTGVWRQTVPPFLVRERCLALEGRAESSRLERQRPQPDRADQFVVLRLKSSHTRRHAHTLFCSRTAVPGNIGSGKLALSMRSDQGGSTLLWSLSTHPGGRQRLHRARLTARGSGARQRKGSANAERRALNLRRQPSSNSFGRIGQPQKPT
jgi:hypothetical protein